MSQEKYESVAAAAERERQSGIKTFLIIIINIAENKNKERTGKKDREIERRNAFNDGTKDGTRTK